MELSVIIPTCNRPDYLRRALDSVARQTFNDSCYEVIVVDNGSNNTSAEVTSAFLGTIKNLRYLSEPMPGLHNARHKGMREAQSDILVYIDDDSEVFPEWLEGVWKGFTLHNAALVGGKNLPKWEEEPPEWLSYLWSNMAQCERFLGYLSILDFGDQEKDINPSYVWGCNFSIRKSVLLEAGGFHPDSMPDELLYLRGDGESYVTRFVASQGYKAVYMPTACVYHFVSRERMTIEYFAKRAFNQGVSDSYTKIRYTNSIDQEAILSPRIQPIFSQLCIKYISMIFGGVSNMTCRLIERVRGRVRIAANVAELHGILTAAYQAGYDYHQAQVKESHELLAWVLMPHYWDGQTPSIHGQKMSQR